jgi:hypothetical protein
METINSIARNNIVIGGYSGFSSSTTLNCEIFNNTVIDCDYGLWFEAHHGSAVGLKFYNNLLINTSTLVNNDGGFIMKIMNKRLSVSPTTIFMDYKAGALNQSDFRIKPGAATQVGTGRIPYPHPDWNFWALLSDEFYDYYGKVRANPPVIGATEIYVADAIDRLPAETKHQDMVVYVHPNPARSFTRLILELKEDRKMVDILVRDIRGRHVRSLYYGPMETGRQFVRWDGRNHLGKRVPSGVYVFRVSLGREVLYQKFQLLR